MSTEEATLIAAIIAASVSILTLIFNFIHQRTSELRSTYRQSLDEYIHDLGEALHETVATSNILLKAKTEPAVVNWRERAEVAKNKLKELRPRLRYPLWGINEGLKTLSRLPDWIEHAKKYPQHASKIYEAGESLSRSLDSAIRKCYMFGRSPNYFERQVVKFKARRLEKSYQDFQNDGSTDSS